MHIAIPVAYSFLGLLTSVKIFFYIAEENGRTGIDPTFKDSMYSGDLIPALCYGAIWPIVLTVMALKLAGRGVVYCLTGTSPEKAYQRAYLQGKNKKAALKELEEIERTL